MSAPHKCKCFICSSPDSVQWFQDRFILYKSNLYNNLCIIFKLQIAIDLKWGLKVIEIHVTAILFRCIVSINVKYSKSDASFRATQNFGKIKIFEGSLKEFRYFRHVYDILWYWYSRFSKFKADWGAHPILRESEYFAGKARKPSRLDTSEISRTRVHLLFSYKCIRPQSALCDRPHEFYVPTSAVARWCYYKWSN